MNINFGDKHLTLNYIQQKLFEQYNSDVKTNMNYYEQFEMNYGFAHYIARYLDLMYPHIMEDKNDLYPGSFTEIRSLDKTISVMNYFLCDNNGNRLQIYESDLKYDPLYRKIYNSNQIDIQRYYKEYDPPLFFPNNYSNIRMPLPLIYPLENWFVNKKICEIDDFILSYLLGRTITPNSSMEDIYYVQKLFIDVDNISKEDRGKWSNIETGYDLSKNYIIPYQRSHLNKYNEHTMFITGYFDIFTESAILKEKGVDRNVLFGL